MSTSDLPSASCSYALHPSPSTMSTKKRRRLMDTEDSRMRASSACTSCRKMKMKCTGAVGKTCRRCEMGGYECLYVASMRGKGRKKALKVEEIHASLKTLETHLDQVLKTLAPNALELTEVTESSPTTSTPPVPIPFDLSTTPSPELLLSRELQPHLITVPLVPPASTCQQLQNEPDSGTHMRGSTQRLFGDFGSPLGLIAESSFINLLPCLSGGSAEESSRREQRKRGPANNSYFSVGAFDGGLLRTSVAENWMIPDLLIQDVLAVGDVDKLFKVFFTHCHPFFSILDRILHTPSETASRSPFLFTCICAVAARYSLSGGQELYRKCLKTAKKMVSYIVTKGFKSLEICQGLLLLCQFNQPGERFEEDRVYTFSGLAIRMAVELNLNRKWTLPADMSDAGRDAYEREILNRERCWLQAYITDKSISWQTGKMSFISREDQIIRGAKGWYRHKMSQGSDLNISALADFYQCFSPVLENLSATDNSYASTFCHAPFIRSVLNQLDDWKDAWSVYEPQNSFDHPTGFRSIVRGLHYSYYRLFVLSFAIQSAPADASVALARYCAEALETAADIITTVQDHLCSKGNLRYGCDGLFLQVSYACCSLLKLLSPSLSSFIAVDKALDLVEDAATALESSAVDATHAPALYACFIQDLLENRFYHRDAEGQSHVEAESFFEDDRESSAGSQPPSSSIPPTVADERERSEELDVSLSPQNGDEIWFQSWSSSWATELSSFDFRDGLPSVPGEAYGRMTFNSSDYSF